RIAAPPAFPIPVRPGPADRPEHIAAEYERAKPIHRTLGVGVINAARAPALAERIFKTLLRPRSETIERDRKACNTHFHHNTLHDMPTMPKLSFARHVAKLGRQWQWQSICRSLRSSDARFCRPARGARCPIPAC